MHAVFTFPDEIARTLVALLEREDLEALTSVSCAARCSFYQAAKTVSATTLLLPPLDEARCSRLLHALARYRSDRLKQFVSIQVAAPFHVDSLLHPSVRGYIENVRLLPFENQKAATVAIMCEKLRTLPHLYQLDVSDTKLEDLSAIVSMTQLRALDLSRTRINRLCGLEALTNLQALMIEDAKVMDVACIENMVNLRVLRVKLPVDDYLQRDRDQRSIHIPPLKKLTKLHTLDLRCCTILSVADLVSIAGSLRTLSFIDVRARKAHWIVDPTPDLGSRLKRDLHEQDLVEQLTQLEKIHVVTSDYVLSGNAESLARIRSVRAISHALQFGLYALTTLVHLEELNINLPQYQRFRYGAHEPEHEDFGFLPHLCKLTTLRVEQSTDPLTSTPASPQRAERVANLLCRGLVQLPRLKNLYYEAYVNCAAVFPKLRSLERLELRCCRPYITSYEWIRSMTSLRSLDIDVCEADTDLSAIGALTQLEAFTLLDRRLKRRELLFLAQLVQLRRLTLEVRIVDLAPLRGLPRLTYLKLASYNSPKNVDVLSSLVRLKQLNIVKSLIKDISPLVKLPALRTIVIGADVDCRPLVKCDHPKLLHVLHPDHDCLWSPCDYRDEKLTRPF